MKVGIEFCRFTKIHNGGKCQVAYNLLKGFYENGHIESIVCFCHEDLREVLLKIAPNVEIVTIPSIYKKGIIPQRVKMGQYLGKMVQKQNVDVMFFTDKIAPIVKTKCKSVLIAHDILVFNASNNKDIDYPTKSPFFEKISIIIDFVLHDYIIAISEFDKNDMLQYIPFSKKKIKKIYNPISFSTCNGNNLKKYITALNIQHLHKNVMTLIKAFNEVKDEIQYDLILVGKKPNNIEEIEEYIKSNNLESRVTLTGFTSDGELESIIQSTRLYVNPSLFEGFGMTSVEMMGDEIPVICADNSAQREVTCERARYYAPSMDSHELAKQILEEIRNPISSEDLKNNASLVRNKYDYRNIAAQYWDFFSSICDRY